MPHDLLRTTATFLGCAALGLTVTLAALAPRATFADGPVAKVALSARGTKLGPVVLEGKLVEDATAKNGWVVLVHAENRGDKAAEVAVATEVTRTVSSPMARVMPMPQAIWTETETLALKAHESVDRRYEVPADAAAKLTADAQAAKDRAARTAKLAKGPKKPQANAAPFDPGVMANQVVHGVRFLPKA
jgi:hypothetical protein